MYFAVFDNRFAVINLFDLLLHHFRVDQIAKIAECDSNCGI